MPLSYQAKKNPYAARAGGQVSYAALYGALYVLFNAVPLSLLEADEIANDENYVAILRMYLSASMVSY